MINVEKIQTLPSNLDDFVREIGAVLRTLYGRAAETAYLKAAEAIYSRTIQHPDVTLWACDSPETPGILMCVVRRGAAHITLLHVLQEQEGKGIEEALLNAVTIDLRDQGIHAIIGEFVRHRPLQIERPLTRLGYSKFDRQLMIADLSDPRLALDAPPITSRCGDRDTLAAGVLVDAYQGHPSRPLHPEAHDPQSAEAFLKTFRAGGFGATLPSLYRTYTLEGDCLGVICAAEATPDVGFILHVASTRSSHGTGIGTHLVRDVAAAFRDAGYARIALGVTCGNPAERLYERLGFEPLIPVETYAWWAAPD